jgi:hypothetical protein
MSNQINNIRKIINTILKEDYRFEYKQTYKTPPHVSNISKKAQEAISKNDLIKKHKEDIGKKIVTGERRAAKLINGEALNYNEVRALRDLFTNLEKEYKNEKTKGKTIDNSAIIQIWELNGGNAAKEWSEGILSRHHGKSMKHKELRRGTGDRNRIGNSKNLMKARLSRKPMSESQQINEADLFIKGGVLFIKGEKLENGQRRLFATYINNLINVDRIKKDRKEGKPGKMVAFGNNQVFRVMMVDGRLKAVGVMWNTKETMLKKLGMTGTSVVLNDNKTPWHWESLAYTSIPMALNKLSSVLEQEKGITWNG